MKKRLMAKILSVFMIVSLFIVNGGIQQQIVQAATASQESNTNSCEIDGIVWNYKVDFYGNAINVAPDETSVVSGSVTIPSTLDGKKVTAIKDYAFAYSYRSLTSITIPDGVVSIGNGAFDSCKNLTSIYIPESVTSIGPFAFYRCDGLSSVNIPKNVTSIEGTTFYNCKSMKEITVAEDNLAYESVDGVLYNKQKTQVINYPAKKEGENYKIPDSVTKISETAFFGCKNLSSIIIPNGVTKIDDNTFTDCEKLSNLTIPESVTNIMVGAFMGCTSLKNIILPEEVNYIDDGAFSRCTSLKSLVIPEGVTKINSDTFLDCTSLRSISIPDSVTSISEDAFKNCTKLTTVYANGGSFASNYAWGDGVTVDTKTGYRKEAQITESKSNAEAELEESNRLLSIYLSVGGLKTDTVYQDLKTILDIYPTTELIEAETDMVKLSSWTSELDGKVKKIYVQIENRKSNIIWDYQINNLGNAINVAPRTKVSGCVIIPDTIDGRKVVSIKDCAFKNNINLVTIIVPEGVTNINDRLFSGCTGLKNISLPDSINTITYSAFENCPNLKTIYVNKEALISYCDFTDVTTNDTKTGYISASKLKDIKDNAIASIGNVDNALSDYIKAGGLETDDVYQNLKMTADIYKATKSIEAEDDISNLVSWTSKIDTKMTVLSAEIKKIKDKVINDIKSNQTTIYYKGYSSPNIHYKIGDGDWTSVPGVAMTETTEMPGYTHKATINLGDADTLTACFNDGNGNWDSRYGANYTFKAGTYDYSNGTITKIADPVKNLIINSFTSNIYGKIKVGTNVILQGNATSDASTIEYKMSVKNSKNEITVIKDYSTDNIATWTPLAVGDYTLILEAKDSNGRILSKEMNLQTKDVSSNQTTIYYNGFSSPNIHYKIGDGNWTDVPGVKMVATTEKPGYTHKITIELGDADTLTACFNDGNGNWDSRYGENYIFNSGTYTYSNGSSKLIE